MLGTFDVGLFPILPSSQMLLTATLALLVLLVIYLATHYTHHSLLLHQQQQRHWLAGLPSHFTIPILSPFTSVVRMP